MASFVDFPNLLAKIKLSIIKPRFFQVLPPSSEIELNIFLLYLILSLLIELLPIARYVHNI